MTLSVSVLALLTLAACGTESGSGSGKGSGGGGDSVQSDVPVTGVAWRVDSVTVGGKKTEAPAGRGWRSTRRAAPRPTSAATTSAWMPG